MSSMETLQTFLGWCTAINFVMMSFAFIMTATMRGAVQGIHAKMFGLSEEDLPRAYFQYLAQYKIVVLVFNFVPWVALMMVA